MCILKMELSTWGDLSEKEAVGGKLSASPLVGRQEETQVRGWGLRTLCP